MSACNYIRTPSLTDIQRDSVSFDLRVAILKGLTSEPKALPSLLLWDDKGLARFEAVRIAESVDYYPSRKEIEVIEKDADDIARSIPTGTALIELGSGYVVVVVLPFDCAKRRRCSVTRKRLHVSCPPCSDKENPLRITASMSPLWIWSLALIYCHKTFLHPAAFSATASWVLTTTSSLGLRRSLSSSRPL